MYGYIYETTNLMNGKKYIGKKKSNVFLGNKYLGSGMILKEAIDKYGKENFSVTLLEECDSLNILNEREKFWISYFNARNSENYYNIASGGDGGIVWKEGNHPSLGTHRIAEENPFYGKHHSKETKDKVKKMWENKIKNGYIGPNTGTRKVIKDNVIHYVKEEDIYEYIEQGWKCPYIEKLNNKKVTNKKIYRGSGMLGKHHSEETKKKIGEAQKGKIVTDEQKEKYRQTMQNKSDDEIALIKLHMSESHKNKKHSEESKKKTSETLKTLYASGKISQKGKTAWNKGRKMTSEELEKHGLISKGRIHITNGVENKMIYPEDFPAYELTGWTRGRTISKKSKIS